MKRVIKQGCGSRCISEGVICLRRHDVQNLASGCILYIPQPALFAARIGSARK
jgi:hypothetical protein